MNKELGRTIKLFLLWCLLYVTTAIIGLILGRVFKNIEFFKWTIVFGYTLIIILFFVKGYVKLSFGRIEKPMIWPAVSMSVLIAVAWLFVLFSVLTLHDVDYLFPKSSESSSEVYEQLFSGLAGILHVCIIVPIVEEIGFRGILLGGLLNSRCRPWLAIIISAIVFALFHMSPLKIASTILFGIILGWLYWRTDSLILCIFIHVVNNSLCAVFSFIDLSIQPHSICLITFSVSLFLLALGLWWFWKKFSYAKPYYYNYKTMKK